MHQVFIHWIQIFVLGNLLTKIRWRPNTNFEGAPIPISFDYEDEKLQIVLNDFHDKIVYYGFRPQDSLHIHETFSNKNSYPFQPPPRSVYMLIEIMRGYSNNRKQSDRQVGTRPNYLNDPYTFDSYLESGTLALVVKIKEGE